MEHPHPNVDRVLLDAQTIDRRVRELAAEVVAAVDEGAELTIVPILTGAMIFAADLIRDIHRPVRINLVTVSSYPGTSLRSRGAEVLQQQLADVKGRDVLLVDDILDSGGTLAATVPVLQDAGANSVRTCVLLHKQLPDPPKLRADYVGFEIPDAFVVGYGLDYDNLYRNLPYIAVLKT